MSSTTQYLTEQLKSRHAKTSAAGSGAGLPEISGFDRNYFMRGL